MKLEHKQRKQKFDTNNNNDEGFDSYNSYEMRVKLVLETSLANALKRRKAFVDLPPLSLVDTSEKLSGAWFLVPEKAKLIGYVCC